MKSWVVVANAVRARAFRVRPKHEPWSELWDLVNPEARKEEQDFVSDKPGRTGGGAGGQYHTLDPSGNAKERVAEQFAGLLADRLNAAHREKEFDRLTVIAAPRFLGQLRGQMNDAVSGAIISEVAKDLTREDARTLQEHVESLTG